MKLFQNRKKSLNIICILSIVLLLVASTVYSITGETKQLPSNPMTAGLADSSDVHLSQGYAHMLEDLDLENEEDNEEDTEKEEDNSDHESNPEETVEDKNREITNQPFNKEFHENIEENESDNTENNNQYKDELGNNKEDINSPNIELKDPEEGKISESKNEYFTTTIQSGEIVTEPDYKFRIHQKDHDLTVNKTEVFVNRKIESNFNGTVRLPEGENEITVKVFYEDSQGNQFSVSQSYIVILNSEEIIILTNLEDNKLVDYKRFNFSASAEQSGNKIPISVFINEKEIKQSSNNKYETKLTPGENLIVLKAKNKGKEVKKSFTIIYEEAKRELIIETNLENKEVSEPSFSFYAIAKENERQIELTITHNNELIEGSKNGDYSVTLQKGKNNFEIIAKNNDAKIVEQYTIVYTELTGGKENENVEREIKLSVPDLKDGQTLRNTVHTFNVKALDEKGKLLTGQGVTISAKNNGESIPVNWANDAHLSFTMEVQDGTNSITISAKDKHGNVATKSITVTGDIAGEGEPIGSITLSLEATTIGIGHIIPPTKIDLYPNERGSETIDRIFDKHGITYDYTGSHDSSFYLSRIYKSGLLSNKTPNIPADLAELVEEQAYWYDPNKYSSSSLGEFDFSNMSGWMYSVNGNYPNVGFADYYFTDGDVVRIRYTIAYGMDIGGGMPGTDFNKEW